MSKTYKKSYTFKEVSKDEKRKTIKKNRSRKFVNMIDGGYFKKQLSVDSCGNIKYTDMNDTEYVIKISKIVNPVKRKYFAKRERRKRFKIKEKNLIISSIDEVTPMDIVDAIDSMDLLEFGYYGFE